MKRSHENWVAGNGGFADEQNHLRGSLSPARRSVESDRVSPSSSNGSVRKMVSLWAFSTLFSPFFNVRRN